MPLNPNDDFYIGYARAAPPSIARTIRIAAAVVILLATVLAAILALVQKPFDPGGFEFGVERHFTGTVRSRPFPMLAIDRPMATDSTVATTQSHYALVAFGKHGALEQVESFEGQRVELAGSLIYQGGSTMIELVEGSIRRVSGTQPARSAEPMTVDLGSRTLQGEIVDSKCYLGVMKPGRFKTHRACAAMCILGGVPPLFHVETSAGEFQHFYLTDEAGGTVNSRVLSLVAEPLEITGQILAQGDVYLLAADPATYRRLSETSQ